MSQTTECPSRTGRFTAGFTMLELVMVIAIVLIVAGIAVPNMLSIIHAARLRGAGSDFSSVLQVARIRSVQDDRFYATYITAGPPPQAYLDLTSNGGTGWVAGDPVIAISPEVKPVAMGSAPDTTNLQGLFLPANSGVTVKDASTTGTPVIFGPRGLPCTTQLAGAVCTSAGGPTAFWIFFQDTITTNWEAVTVSPSGRIQKWQHAGTGWSRL